MADGCYFEKSLDRHYSATVPLIFTNFGMMAHFGHLYPVYRNKYEFLQPKMADSCHFEKLKLQ